MLSPAEVTPPLSNAFRYSSATDLRCSSVIVCRVRVIALSFPLGPAREHDSPAGKRQPDRVAPAGDPEGPMYNVPNLDQPSRSGEISIGSMLISPKPGAPGGFAAFYGA
jgi:hypothetical protein